MWCSEKHQNDKTCHRTHPYTAVSIIYLWPTKQPSRVGSHVWLRYTDGNKLQDHEYVRTTNPSWRDTVKTQINPSIAVTSYHHCLHKKSCTCYWCIPQPLPLFKDDSIDRPSLSRLQCSNEEPLYLPLPILLSSSYKAASKHG